MGRGGKGGRGEYMWVGLGLIVLVAADPTPHI